MKDSFIFTREAALAISPMGTNEKCAAVFYAIQYGLGEIPASDKPEYANLTRCIDRANKARKEVPLEIVQEISGYLNKKCETIYRPTAEGTRRLIGARLGEGYTVEDFKAVIDCMADEWRGTEMERYLRPETLFSPKFESYINHAKAKEKKSSFNTDQFFEAALARTYGGAAE